MKYVRGQLKKKDKKKKRGKGEVGKEQLGE